MVSGIFNSAVSGLQYNAARMNAAADNVANVSTRGYKRTDIPSQSITTPQTSTAYSAGGVQGLTRPLNDVQGLLAPSTSATDLAVSGSGYFAVSYSSQGGPVAFTRDGSFDVDSEGYLVNASGHYLLASQGGEDLQPVNVERIGGTAEPTSEMSIGANLPANANVGDTFTINARATDSLGGELDIQLNFESQGGGDYALTVGTITETATGATSAMAREGSNSGPAYETTVSFSGDGLVSNFDGERTPPVLNISGLSNGANDLNVNLDLGAVGGANGLTQYGSEFIIGHVQSDGAQYGSINSVQVGENGTVSATFDNGQVRTVAQIELAVFTNPNGLSALSGGAYTATDISGAANFQLPGQGGAGTVQSGALELSTTDLATEFTTMLMAENAYKASVSILQAADEMSQSLLDELG